MRLQKLEALLERVRRNRTAAPVRSSGSTAANHVASGSAAVVSQTPRAPAVVASAPPARVEPPPRIEPPRVEPPPRIEPPVRAEPSHVEPPPRIEPPPHVEAPRVEAPVHVEPPHVEPPHVEPPPYLEPPAPVAPPAAAAPPVEPPPPVTTPSWRPEPGSAVQARPTSIPPMEISDDDLLEVSTLPPVADTSAVEVEVTQAESVELDADEEQPPASSRRFKVPEEGLDEGVASVSSSESEREIPVKTPPPESGPQEALPATGLEAPRMPDVAELEADLSGPPSMGPTAEQLGETIELEAPRGPELEIDVTIVAEEEMPAAAEELEVSLPRPSMQSGLYDVPVTAPAPEAPPAARAATPSTRAPAEGGPERTLRPALGATDVAHVALVAPSSAKTFVELLDASLGL